jgi:hypothetical protein
VATPLGIRGFAERRDGHAFEAATRAYLPSRQPTGRFISLASVGAMAALLCAQPATLPIDREWSTNRAVSQKRWRRMR